MPVPIFVLGKQRSGTTGVANRLCAHPELAGVQHERHHGVHESAYFSHVDGRYGDLRMQNNYRELVEVLLASDYFRLAGATREFLYSLWPTSYAAFFRSVMDRYAEERGARGWVEKTPTHTIYVDRLARYFPDARFVGVRRDVGDVVASSVHRASDPAVRAGGWPRMAHLLRTALSWGYYDSVLRRLEPDRALVVSFERFRTEPEPVLREVCAFLDLPFSPEMLRETYPPNTSYGTREERARALDPRERRIAALAGRLGTAAPGALVRLDLRRRDRRRRPLPRWFFRLYAGDAARPHEVATLEREAASR